MSLATGTDHWPKISLVTPSFNQGQFIRHTIDSVLNQKYPNLEYWVMDGGSTDDTVAILKSFGKRINWVSQKDKGQTDALNQGLQKCTGDIVAYINSDDVLLPGTLAKVASYFQAHPTAQWVTGDYQIIDAQGKQYQSYVVWYKKLLRLWPTQTVLSIANFIIQPSTFWRRSLHDELGFFDESRRYCMDFDFWLRVIQRYPLQVISEPLSQFRIHAQSKGGADYRKQFTEEHQVVQKYTQNAWLLRLHWWHAQAIMWIYDRIK